jgi:phosphatidate cytidylyltransferase
MLSLILVSLLLGIFSQAGDLFESLVKRAAGAKDSGALIPGHGGILDRIDGLLLAAPPFYYFLQWAAVS